jgi:hypothetical protein
MTEIQLTDKGEMIMFIDGQFRRLGMFYETEKGQRNEFIKQLDTRSRWWVLMRVVEYVNGRWKNYYSWCDW